MGSWHFFAVWQRLDLMNKCTSGRCSWTVSSAMILSPDLPSIHLILYTYQNFIRLSGRTRNKNKKQGRQSPFASKTDKRTRKKKEKNTAHQKTVWLNSRHACKVSRGQPASDEQKCMKHDGLIYYLLSGLLTCTFNQLFRIMTRKSTPIVSEVE